MARIRKINSFHFLIALISLVLFFIPFFWLSPGEVDLGGDSSRLYFYDPWRFLLKNTLYGLSPSGTGREIISFHPLPLFILLTILKSILRSPTLLISSFQGMSLTFSFLFCYLSVKELMKTDLKKPSKRLVLELAAILAGLFYNFAPGPIRGWNRVILTHNQVFVNPLMFYFLLRLFVTGKTIYLFISLLITFIFSTNFSYTAAPPFFSFYPLSFLFLLFYTKFIKKKNIPVKKLFLGLILFVMLQSFHLIPQVATLLNPGSSTYQAIFSSQSRLGRGLGYFLGIVSNIKVSLSLMQLPQLMELEFYFFIFIIFPAVIILGFLFNKSSKTLLLTGAFFLITIFFASANITNIGLAFYKKLFIIPGFSMFRNFYGQWGVAFLFFYCLLLGQATLIVFSRLKRFYCLWFGLGMIFLLLITAWPFINGELVTGQTHWQSEEVVTTFKIDPQFEEMLEFINNLPGDGKILTLPLTDPGYQIVSGQKGGAYKGPSMISRLTNKQDFSGYQELESFRDNFLKFVKAGQYQEIKKILSLLGIKYIFHNADPGVYLEKFPGFPYQHVSKFMPASQTEYRDFIFALNGRLIKKIGPYYHFYQIEDQNSLPAVFVAERRSYWDQPMTDISTSLSIFTLGRHQAFCYKPVSLKEQAKQIEIADDVYLTAKPESLFLDFLVRRDDDELSSPFISQKLSFIFYPLVIAKEEIQLKRAKGNDDRYFDLSLFFAEKRINEMQTWQDEIKILGGISSFEEFSQHWQNSEPGKVSFNGNFNYWEISLVRYQKRILKLIEAIEGFENSRYSLTTNKVNLRGILSSHEKRLNTLIREAVSFKEKEKIYLLELVYQLFESLYQKLDLKIPNPLNIPYRIENVHSEGNYQVYVEAKWLKKLNPGELKLMIDGHELKNTVWQPEKGWFRFEEVPLRIRTSHEGMLNISSRLNLVKDTTWHQLEAFNLATPSAQLVVDDSSVVDTRGLIREVKDWDSKSYYLVSFDYHTFGKLFQFYLFERIGKDKENIEYIGRKSEAFLRSKEWKHYEILVESDDRTQSAFIQILRAGNDLLGERSGNTSAKIAIKNLAVVPVPHPKIIFQKKLTPENQAKPRPKIFVTKINPSKYHLKIRDASQPYTLVFLQAFNPNWRLFDITQEASRLKPRLTRLMGSWGKFLISPFSHLFSETDPFETWGKTEIGEYTHWPGNIYANSWYLTPDDVNGRTDYELVLEMSLQKYFLAGSFISLIALLLTSGGLAFKIFRR